MGEQKQFHQSKKRGKRLNIRGTYEPKKSLNYIKMGIFKTPSLLRMLNIEALEAQKYRVESGVDTVIVMDNYPIHNSHQVIAS